MIIDELADKSPCISDVFSNAQIVQVPFRVSPIRKTQDGQSGYFYQEADRIPKGIEPLNSDKTFRGEWANPPFKRIVIFGNDSDESGVIVTETIDKPKFPREKCRYIVEATWLGRSERGLNGIGVSVSQIEIGDLICPELRWHILGLWIKKQRGMSDYELEDTMPENILSVSRECGFLQLDKEAKVAGHLNYSKERAWKIIEEKITLDTMKDWIWEHYPGWHSTLATVASAFCLMNCKNTILVPVVRPHRRASRRRGDPEPYKYSILRISQALSRRVGGEVSGRPDEHVAIHWVRGHFKEYSEARPLFGKLSGLFWWQPHLAGRLHESFSDKEYAVA